MPRYGSAKKEERKTETRKDRQNEALSQDPGLAYGYDRPASRIKPVAAKSPATIQLKPEDVMLATAQNDDDDDDIARGFQAMLEESRSEGHTCLVCIDTVALTDPVWQCGQCYSQFHLPCIQSWVRQCRVMQLPPMALSGDVVPKADHDPEKWFCPKCRHAYFKQDEPTRYLCFCGKLSNPEADPWAPHTCGQTCGKALDPPCGHTCHESCHPGKCPPCVLVVEATCHCGANIATKRCRDRSWSCGKICNRTLSCGKHACKDPCHPGFPHLIWRIDFLRVHHQELLAGMAAGNYPTSHPKQKH